MTAEQPGNASSPLRQDAKRPRAKGLFEAGTFARGPLVNLHPVIGERPASASTNVCGPRTARAQTFRGSRSEPSAWPGPDFLDTVSGCQ